MSYEKTITDTEIEKLRQRSRYSDKLMEWILEKGPSADFWFFTAIISGFSLFVWLILKEIGFINTPIIVKLIPYLGGLAAFIGLAFSAYDKVRTRGKEFGRLEIRMENVEKELRSFRQDYKDHIVKYHT